MVPPCGAQTKLNAGAQPQTFPYPTASKAFLYLNTFMTKSKSLAQPLPFKSVTDKQTIKHRTFSPPPARRLRTEEVHTTLAPQKLLCIWGIVLPLGGAENFGGKSTPRFNPIIPEPSEQIPQTWTINCGGTAPKPRKFRKNHAQDTKHIPLCSEEDSVTDTGNKYRKLSEIWTLCTAIISTIIFRVTVFSFYCSYAIHLSFPNILVK